MILYLFQMSPSLNDFPIRLKANSSRCGEASGPLSHVQLFWKKILVTCKQSIIILYIFTFEHLYAAMSGQWDLVERRNEGISHLREALEREMMEEALAVFGEKNHNGRSFWSLRQCHQTWRRKFLLVLCAWSSGCASLKRHLAEWALSRCLCRSYCAIESEPLA